MTIRVSYIKDKKIIAEREITEKKLLLGREGDVDFIQREEGLSREHGEVMIFEHFMLYKDLGSTNGSWMDGKKLHENKWEISSYPCFLQLANVILGFSQDVGVNNDINIGALAIFRDGEFFQYLPINKTGKSMTIGGEDANFILPNSDLENKAHDLVLETRNGILICYSNSNQFEIKINNIILQGKGLVNDGDKILIGNFEIYVTLFKPSLIIYDSTSTEDEKQAMRLKMIESAVPTLKSWEDEDFDATDVFEKKREAKILNFQKNNPVLSDKEILNLYKGTSFDFALLEKIIFWTIAALLVLVVIFLVLSIFIR